MSDIDQLSGIYDRIGRISSRVREEQKNSDDRFNVMRNLINEMREELETHRKRMVRIEARIAKHAREKH